MALVSRTPNFSPREKHLLITTVNRYKELIENRESNAASLKLRSEAWHKIVTEFNMNSDQPRSVKQIKNLYFNLKRRLKKDLSIGYKEEYLQAKKATATDKKEIKKTGGETYHPNLNEARTRLLAVVADQTLPNEFEDTSIYFGQDAAFGKEQFPTIKSEAYSPTRPSSLLPEVPVQSRRIKKKIDYKEMYFKKKYELACFELKSKRILHSLDVKIKTKQLEQLNN